MHTFQGIEGGKRGREGIGKVQLRYDYCMPPGETPCCWLGVAAATPG